MYEPRSGQDHVGVPGNREDVGGFFEWSPDEAAVVIDVAEMIDPEVGQSLIGGAAELATA